jgi:hypothetical protein
MLKFWAVGHESKVHRLQHGIVIIKPDLLPVKKGSHGKDYVGVQSTKIEWSILKIINDFDPIEEVI